jgi:hypothetical protein
MLKMRAGARDPCVTCPLFVFVIGRSLNIRHILVKLSQYQINENPFNVFELVYVDRQTKRYSKPKSQFFLNLCSATLTATE